MSKGQVVIVNNKNSPHHGKKGVIQYESLTGDSYWIRDLQKIPILERFSYDNRGKVRGTRAPEKRFRVLKSSVKKTSQRAPANINTWQPETGRLLEENEGLTRAQIKKKFS